MNLKELSEQIHAAAVEKGFWAIERAEEKHIAKMHSELSEALEEDRCGRPLLYVDDFEEERHITDVNKFENRKPEGVAAELADFVMMTLDWAAMRCLELKTYGRFFAAHTEAFEDDVVALILLLHKALDSNDLNGYLTGFMLWLLIKDVDVWLEKHGVDLWEVVRLKMAYNKTRPKLHGKKY